MKKYIVILTIVILAFVGCKRPQKGIGVPREEKSYTVKTGSISKKLMETGVCQPKNTVKVMSKVAGEIATVLVDEGDSVELGRSIAYVYPSIKELQKISLIKKNYVIFEKEFNNHSIKYGSYKEMLKGGFISQNEFDEIERAFLNAKFSFENIKLEKDYISDLQEKMIKGKLAYSIPAPANGIFYGKNITKGELIRAAMEEYVEGAVLGFIGTLDDMEILINLDEVDAPNIKKGQKCLISFDSFPGVNTTGVVDYISLNASKTGSFNQFSVRVSVDKNPRNLIKPGISANINIVILEINDVLVIPLRSVQWSVGKPTVLLGNDKVPTPLKLGQSDAALIEVIEGLKEGDVIFYKERAPTMGGGAFFF